LNNHGIANTNVLFVNFILIVECGPADLRTRKEHRFHYRHRRYSAGSPYLGYNIDYFGNSLRRILLSSLQGAAIVSVKFDNVVHEFSMIPGVLEDVTDIILNLKEIRLKLIDAEEAVIQLTREEEGMIKAGDIETDGSVEILNPEQHIATLSKKGTLNIEMLVKLGKGYIPAEKDGIKDYPIGVILLDASFRKFECKAAILT